MSETPTSPKRTRKAKAAQTEAPEATTTEAPEVTETPAEQPVEQAPADSTEPAAVQQADTDGPTKDQDPEPVDNPDLEQRVTENGEQPETGAQQTTVGQVELAGDGDDDDVTDLEGPADAEDVAILAEGQVTTIPAAALPLSEGPGIPAPVEQARTAEGTIDPGDQHHAAAVAAEVAAGAARLASALGDGDASSVRAGTLLPPAAAAPLDAPQKKVIEQVSAAMGGLDQYALSAAKQRRSVILDDKTRQVPDLEVTLQPLGPDGSHVVVRELVQTQFFGVHSKPAIVLAFGEGRVLSAQQVEHLRALVAEQARLVAEGADTSRPLDQQAL